MEISKKRLDELERSELKLNALELGGVDNWDNYYDALEPYRKEFELKEKREKLLDDILQALGSGAYEPSERGAGIAFSEEAEEAAVNIITAMGVKFVTATELK